MSASCGRETAARAQAYSGSSPAMATPHRAGAGGPGTARARPVGPRRGRCGQRSNAPGSPGRSSLEGPRPLRKAGAGGEFPPGV